MIVANNARVGGARGVLSAPLQFAGEGTMTIIGANYSIYLSKEEWQCLPTTGHRQIW